MADKVDASFVKERLRSGVMVVNVLAAEQFDQKRIPGTVNVPVEAPDFQERIQDAVPNKEAEVIVHCASATCPASPKAARKMESLGYTNVKEYSAGIQGWEEAEYRLEGSDVRERPPRPESGAERADRRAREIPPFS